MSAQTLADLLRGHLADLLRRRPFEPFTVRMSSGETHRVDDPEFAFVLRSNLVIGYSDTDRFAICSVAHIAQVDTEQPA